MALKGEVNSHDRHESDRSDNYAASDDEAFIRAAEKRINKRREDDGNVVLWLCLRSGRESTMVQMFDNGLQPTAHDGQIFSATMCELQ